MENKWIETLNGVIVNENNIAEILPPRERGEQWTFEVVMNNHSPSRQEVRELHRGTEAECNAFFKHVKSKLDIISKPAAKKPATKKPTSTPTE